MNNINIEQIKDFLSINDSTKRILFFRNSDLEISFKACIDYIFDWIEKEKIKNKNPKQIKFKEYSKKDFYTTFNLKIDDNSNNDYNGSNYFRNNDNPKSLQINLSNIFLVVEIILNEFHVKKEEIFINESNFQKKEDFGSITIQFDKKSCEMMVFNLLHYEGIYLNEDNKIEYIIDDDKSYNSLIEYATKFIHDRDSSLEYLSYKIYEDIQIFILKIFFMKNNDETRFPFVQENIFLIPQIEKETGYQNLVIQKVNSDSGKIEFEYEFKCIYSTSIFLPDFNNFLTFNEYKKFRKNFAKEILNVNITNRTFPEDIFSSFKEWVKETAESGIETLILQTNKENVNNYQFMVIKILLKSLVEINSNYAILFFEYIKKTCLHAGIYDYSILRTNLNTIFDLFDFYYCHYFRSAFYYKEYYKELSEESYFYIRYPKYDEYYNTIQQILMGIAEIDSEFLFQESDFYINRFIVSNKFFSKYDEYCQLIPNGIATGLTETAKNPDATKFEEYKKFFKDNGLKMSIAQNPNATKFEEYKRLYADKDGHVRQCVAENPNATCFEEYKQLFNDTDEWVRFGVAMNPNATRFEEYKKLFNDPSKAVRKGVTMNPNATRLNELIKR